MRSGWTRFLPGWPAGLLIPAVVAFWTCIWWEVTVVAVAWGLPIAYALTMAVDLALLRPIRAAGMKNLSPEKGEPPEGPGKSSRLREPHLTLKLLVMCVVLAVFVWGNIWDRWCACPLPKQPVAGRTYTSRATHRGLPWVYRTEVRELVTFGKSGQVEPAYRPPVGVETAQWGPLVGPLLLNMAVALTVSVALALASERFVFSRLRRGPRPETQEEPT
jgi:hypothetical protein